MKDTNLLKKEFARDVWARKLHHRFADLDMKTGEYSMPEELFNWFESKLIGEREDSVREYAYWTIIGLENREGAKVLGKMEGYLKSKSGGIK
jgi:hypothetical protein